MSLKIVVLVKQVPDTHNVTGDAMKPDGTVNRAALPAITNPEDLNALEEALKIKTALSGTTITAITLGPPGAVKTLKEALYRGVDDAVLVTDPKFAASDTLATSYALKCAIEKVGAYDLIFCGRQAIDGDTAQVGPQIAEKLNLNQISCITEVIETTPKSITVRRSLEDGYEIVKSNLPALLTVTGDANEPRPPSAKRVMMYKNIENKCEPSNESYMHPDMGNICSHIKQWSATDINADLNLCGLAGSPTKVKQIESVVLAARDTKQIANNETEIKALINELIQEHIIG
ncbi:MAG: electron transfer flavoprotein subunit beta/FixA family protein [Gammaproteobacteria bacterium]|nr:electron transfer flavoprotein subunit beta/FixA family protein [Gammaproteobacteria bacterium]